MPKRKEAERFAVLGEKDCWHLYTLQGLSPNKFASVVSNVLAGRLILVNTRDAGKQAPLEHRAF
jgi:hypothetical protein